MAFIGDIAKVIKFIHQTKDHPLIKFQLERSCLNAEDIVNYESFMKIKPLSKFELAKAQGGKLPCGTLLDCSKVTRVFQSPGPIYNVKGADNEHYRFYKGLEKAGFKKGDIVLNTFCHNIAPAGDMFDEACVKLGAVVIPMGAADTHTGAEFIKHTGANAFIGVKTYLVKILKELGDKNTITKAYLIAEKLTEEDRIHIKEEFGVDAFQGYGSAELGLIAYECEKKCGMHVDTDVIFLETLEHHTSEAVEAGSAGEAVCTFLNETTPFLRLATGDLTVINPDKCLCGAEEGIIDGIFGRADASVKVKAVFIHFWQFNDLFESINVFGQLKVSTAENGVDSLDLVMNIPSEGIEEKFQKRFKLRLNSIEINDKIEKTEIIDSREHLKDK